MGDEGERRTFYETRTATEVAADVLSEEWKGRVVQIGGGSDKQGLPMTQGVLTHGHVCLLLRKGHSHERPRRIRHRQRKHRSVQGCIVGADLSVFNLVIVFKKKKKKVGERIPVSLAQKG